MEWKIELIGIPVTDVDRARDFYQQIGWQVDWDHTVSEQLRFVQVTPPGSACSICFGTGLGSLTDRPPGSARGIQLVVPDADEALAFLRQQGASAQGVDDQPWGRFVTFQDPDGNEFTLQQLLPRS
jgi:predicted enzyme related to lactoylglutathione lyase